MKMVTVHLNALPFKMGDFPSASHITSAKALSRSDAPFRIRKRRRKSSDLRFNERWNCPHGCGKFYRKTSSRSIRDHLAECTNKITDHAGDSAPLTASVGQQIGRTERANGPIVCFPPVGPQSIIHSMGFNGPTMLMQSPGNAILSQPMLQQQPTYVLSNHMHQPHVFGNTSGYVSLGLRNATSPTEITHIMGPPTQSVVLLQGQPWDMLPRVHQYSPHVESLRMVPVGGNDLSLSARFGPLKSEKLGHTATPLQIQRLQHVNMKAEMIRADELSAARILSGICGDARSQEEEPPQISSRSG